MMMGFKDLMSIVEASGVRYHADASHDRIILRVRSSTLRCKRK